MSNLGITKKASADFYLTDLDSDKYDCWKIEGTLGNGESIAGYIVHNDDASELVLKNQPEGNDRVILSYNHFKFVSAMRTVITSGWGTGTRITFTPIMSASTDCPVVAKSNNEAQGSASVSGTSEVNRYALTAKANDGFAFSYWLREGSENITENQIIDNPYIVTADTEVTYFAYFRESYNLKALSEDEAKGTVNALAMGSESGADHYRLTAIPNDYYVFDKWVSGTHEYTENPLNISVSENGLEYIAHFKLIELTLSDVATYQIYGDVTSDVRQYDGPVYGGILSEGCRSALNIPVSVPKRLENVTIQVRVTNANNDLVAQCELNANLNINDYLNVAIASAQKANSTLNAEVSLVTPAGNITATKTYTDFIIESSEINNCFKYITSPGIDYGDISVLDAGPNINGIYATSDANTKSISLYFYGDKGVYLYDTLSSPNLVVLDGLANQNVLAMGSADNNGLIAVAKSASGSFGLIALYSWDGATWSQVNGSVLAASNANEVTTCALAIQADDVWTDTKHWTGENWEDHQYSFASFKSISETVYGIDRSGQWWKYNGSEWNISACAYPSIGSIANNTTANSQISIGQDHHNDWYLMIPSKGHYIDASGWYSYIGSDVYKWNDDEWVYQIMSEFDDPDDNPLTETTRRIRPDGVNGLSSPAPGLSIMYGSGSSCGRGSLYLYADDVTITFNPGEGTLDNAALGTLTAPILSEIDSSKVPGASRSDYSFGGWYYDEACTIEFDASNTAMPGESITLYAKWSDGSDPEAQLAWYKQKALKDLEKQYKKYSSADYTSENWSALQSAYIDGVSAINAATAGAAHIEDNVTAALNAAIAAMQAVPAKNSGEITVAISMDANTLGLGYLLEPTLVTVDKGTPVSVVIADLLNKRAADQYDITTEGRTDKPNVESIATLYPWSSSGTPTSGFYLAQVYFPEQSGYSVPETIMNYIISNDLNFLAEDANGKYLGETDYLNTSGWVYSVGDKTNGEAEFPGVGSSGWGLSDGEVVRFQFTLVGYGADLGADNTAWGTSNILSVGDKSALTWKVAELRSQYSDTTLKAEAVYTDALTVLTDAEATQSAIDAALEALNSLSIAAPEEVPDEKISITGEDGGNPVAAVTSEISSDGTATLHVTAANPCVVIVKKADGTYERLEAVDNGNGGYDFIQAGYTETMEFVVAVKGDYDGDGAFQTIDLANANKDIVNNATIDPLKALIMGAENGQTLKTINLANLNKSKINDDLTW